MLVSRIVRTFIMMILTAALSACAVGPDFKPPASPTLQRYIKPPITTSLTAGREEPRQQLQMGDRIAAQWWTLFHSDDINHLVSQAVANNQTLASAKATLAGSQEAILQAAGSLYPQVDANAGLQRSQQGTAMPTNLFTVGATINYVVDVFGGTRRTIEQKQALAQNQLYQLGAAYLSLTGNVVTLSITSASLRGQLTAAQGIIESDKQNLKLVRDKYLAGKAAKIDVLTAESQLANDQTLLPVIRQQISVNDHAISVLMGKPPGIWSPPAFDLTRMALPGALPVSMPSELVHQRPDILAAEAQLHADSAAIGIATAQMFPSITLSGLASFESSTANTLFNRSSLFWNIAAGLTAPVFHGGTLMSQRRQAIDTFKADAAIYQQTVLEAFAQVADTLRALKNDADQLKAQKLALETAKESLTLQRISYHAGKSDLLLLLNAERSYHQALQGFVRALGQRYLDTAQLFLAMGGDWPSRNNGKCVFLDKV